MKLMSSGGKQELTSTFITKRPSTPDMLKLIINNLFRNTGLISHFPLLPFLPVLESGFRKTLKVCT